jgi:hypothetical protein
MNQQLTFLSDGSETVRDLQLYLRLEAEHLLDWFHLSMHLTIMQQSAKSLPLTIQDEEEVYVLRDAVVRELEWRSTASHGHPRRVSMISVTQVYEKWTHSQRQTESSLPRLRPSVCRLLRTIPHRG